MKKVALTGTQGCGKTTILEDVYKLLIQAGYKIAKGWEVARKCPYDLNKQSDFITQWYLLSKQIEQESQLARECDNLLLDRSVFDVLAYTFRQTQHHVISMEEYLVTRGAVLTWANWFPYDTLIHIGPLHFIEDDGVRDTDKEYQKEILYVINMMLANDVPPKTNTILLEEKDREKRADKVFNIVSKVFDK